VFGKLSNNIQITGVGINVSINANKANKQIQSIQRHDDAESKLKADYW